MIPEIAKIVMNKFIEKGFSVYVIGSFVRDFLVSRSPGRDINLVTNATKNEIYDVLSSEYSVYSNASNPATYIRLPDLKISIEPFNRATPNGYVYVQSLREHCHDVDFSINAVAMDIDMKTYDYFEGKLDAKFGILSTIKEPLKALECDNLLALKAISLSAYYGFTISTALEAYMYAAKNDISMARTQTITYHFNRIICAKQSPSIYVNRLRAAGLLYQIIPELEPCYNFNQYRYKHPKDVYGHILDVLDHVEPKLELRLAALFHDIGKPLVFKLDESRVGHFEGHERLSAEIAQHRLFLLQYTPERIERVTKIVNHHMSRFIYEKEIDIDGFINAVGETYLDDLFRLQLADVIVCIPPFKLDNLYKLKFDCLSFINSRDTRKPLMLSITTADLTSIGLYTKDIVLALDYAEQLVKFNDVENSKQALLRKISQKFKK